jgi:hypothetical protein
LHSRHREQSTAARRLILQFRVCGVLEKDVDWLRDASAACFGYLIILKK